MNCNTPVCSNPCPLSRWCHPTILFPVSPFSSCPQFFPASESFPMGQLFASGGQSGISTLASVLPMNIQGWLPLGLTGLISLLSKGLSRIFSSTTFQKHQFLSAQPSLGPTLTSIHDYWKNHSFDYMDFVGNVMSLLSNMLSSFIISSQLFLQGANIFWFWNWDCFNFPSQWSFWWGQSMKDGAVVGNPWCEFESEFTLHGSTHS